MTIKYMYPAQVEAGIRTMIAQIEANVAAQKLASAEQRNLQVHYNELAMDAGTAAYRLEDQTASDESRLATLRDLL